MYIQNIYLHIGKLCLKPLPIAKVMYLYVFSLFFSSHQNVHPRQLFSSLDKAVHGQELVIWLDYNFERSVYTPELKSSKMQDSFYSTTQNLLPVVTDTGGRGQHYFRLG